MPKELLRVVRVTLFLILLAGVAAAQSETADSITPWLLREERPNIDKIVDLTAREHSIILFQIATPFGVIGYAKDGKLQWIAEKNEPACTNPAPALSRDGTRIAYLVGNQPDRKCHLRVYDTVSQTERELGAFIQPGPAAWSWDDSKIGFFQSEAFFVSVSDGAQHIALEPAEALKDVTYYSHGFSLQWLHDNHTLIIEVERDIPTGEPNTHSPHVEVLSVSDGAAKTLGTDIGDSAVSPTSDEIAAISDGTIIVMSADGTARRVVAKAPRQLLLFHEFLAGPLVWSRDGNRLFFETIGDNYGETKIYLLTIKNGQRQRFLSHTHIDICGWY